ncbi:MAG: hypothetical protein RLN88_13115 [Ekhidna sp.]|uniref:hypothetical protein n=1 Tax=Ekhidna sp. TaxID=2608089 RepID=UPI0032EEB36C
MKKILLLLLSISLIWSTGCGGDDDTGSFVGVWIGLSVEVINCANENNNSFDSFDCDEESCFRLELKDDGTYTYQEGLAIRSGDWNASGGLTLCTLEDGEEVCENYSASAAGSTLVYSFINETTECETLYTFIREEEFNQIGQGQ